jgi:hypothetical protein
MVNVSGSGQGQYGEGYGDLNGVIITDQPILGFGFQNNCNAGIRSANNNLQYPCSGEIHSCGQLISGCFWSTRNQLVISNPSNYLSLLGAWAVNSVQLHHGDLITPQITIDVMTLDDNDGDITNGTPHYEQIQAGFSAHSMPGPAIDALSFSYPDGLPATLDPEGGDTMQVLVTTNLSNTLNTSSGKLYIDPESDGSFVSIPMAYLGSNTFRATFPAIECNSAVRFYVEAKTGSGTTLRNPINAPSSYYLTLSAMGFSTPSWTDNCETNPGWVASRIVSPGAENPPFATGDWGRGIPVPTIGSPTADYDGSGKCWLTGNYSGAAQDPMTGIAVALTSPTIPGVTSNSLFTYAKWFSVQGGQSDDTFVVQVSNNNGGSWVTAETTTTSTSGWAFRFHRFADFVPVTSQMKVRFVVSDAGEDTVVEAGLDDFAVTTVACVCPADYNGDGFVNGDDADGFYAAFDAGDPSADFDGNGFVNGDDADAFSVAFNAGC